MIRLIGPPFLFGGEVQRIFGINARRLKQWREDGLLTPVEVIPLVPQYPRDQVEKLANEPGEPADLARRQPIDPPVWRRHAGKPVEPADRADRSTV